MVCERAVTDHRFDDRNALEEGMPCDFPSGYLAA